MAIRKVLYVEYHTFIAGGQVVLLNHFKALDPARYVPVLVVPTEGPFTREARETGIQVFVIPFKKARWRLFWQAIPATLKLARLIRDEKIDLVDANSYPANKIAAVAARLAGVPCIWHKHILAKARFSTTGFLWRLYARLDQRIIGPSDRVVQSLREMGVPASKLRRIYNGIDIKKVQSYKPLPRAVLRKAGFPDTGPVLGAVAMHRTHKGLDVLLRAFQAVAAGHKQAKLVIIGDPQNAEESLEATLQELAADPSLKGRVYFLPGQRNIPAWMRHFDILVSPSRWEVGAPLVPMEAMALGVPVIATDTSSGELIQDGVNGLIVKNLDVDGLSAAMLRLLKDRTLAARLALKGRATVVKKHSLGRYAEALMENYDEVLADYAHH